MTSTTVTSRPAAAARLLTATVGATAAAMVTLTAGRWLPAGPSTGWVQWATSTSIDAVAIRAVWLVAVLIALSLAVSQALALVAYLVYCASGLRLAARVAGRLTSRFCVGSIAASLAALAVANTAGADLTATSSPDAHVDPFVDPPGQPLSAIAETAPTMVLVDARTAPDPNVGPPTMTMTVDVPAAPDLSGVPGGGGTATDATGAPVMHLEVAAPAAAEDPGPAEVDPGSAVTSSTVDQVATTLEVWTVRSGDNLWDIADTVVTQHGGSPASTEQVDGYWRRLVAWNAAHLADPSNPDLLFTGQAIELPPL